MTRTWRRWMAYLVLVLFLGRALVPAGAARASEFDEAKLARIRQAMQKFVDDKQVSGVVAVVGSSKGVAALDAVGLANIANNTSMTVDLMFLIASMTKPITALAIMMLVDEGKLTVADPVEKHLPEFRGQLLRVKADKEGVLLKAPARPITIRDLLTHTSGLPNFPAGMSDIYGKRNYTLAEATAAMSQRPLDFEPGTKWAYCNSGIDTLGRIVEVASKQRFEDFLQERIFNPLGMKDTTFYPTKEQMQRVATMYARKGDQLVDATGNLIGSPVGAKHPIPAGGLYSTGKDLAKLYQAMLQGAMTADKKRLISEKSLQAMTALQTGDLKGGFTPGTGFGFGWAVVKEPQGVTAMLAPGSYGHGGAFGTQGWLDPKQDVFVVLLVQRVGMPNGDASALRQELQALAIGALKK